MATDDTVCTRLAHWSKTDPARAAFIFRSETNRVAITREKIFTLASRCAAFLRRKGIRKGDVVCNTLPNSPERLLTDLGVMLAGGVTMNGQIFLADGADLIDTLQKSKCVAVLTDPGQPVNALSVLKSRLKSFEDDTVECPDAPHLQLLLQVDCKARNDGKKPFLEKLEQEEETFVADVQPSDPAFVFTTSGSTGFSKLVLRDHAGFLTTGQTMCYVFDHKPDDVYFNDRLLGWVGGAPIAYLHGGVTRVLTDLSSPAKDPLALAWKTIKCEACTLALLVPLHLDLSLARPDLWNDMKTKLRRVLTGGQPVRKQHVEVVGKLTDRLAVGYGSTECGFVTCRSVDQHDKQDYQDGDSGVLLPGMEVKLVDKNNHEVVKEGQAGEVLVRGRTLLKGYFGVAPDGDPALVHPCTEDGWFNTTDVAFRGPDGHLHVVCRKTNAIIHGAIVVYPGWLEMRMEKCPGVQNVIIVPVPDPTLYQELCACVVPQPGVKLTADEVREFCKSLFLVPESAEMSQVPRYYVFFDSFPTTATGKTDRKAILATALDRLGIPASDPTANGTCN